MADTSGYAPGKGRTFTPSLSATWTNNFNQMMSDQKYSRNKLTEKLIEDGLKYNKLFTEDNVLPLNLPEGLNQEQINILKSEQGSRMLSNFIGVILGGGFGIVDPKNIQSFAFPEQNTSMQRVMTDEIAATKQELEPETEKVEANANPVTEPSFTAKVNITGTQTTQNSNRNSALEKAMKRKNGVKFRENNE